MSHVQRVLQVSVVTAVLVFGSLLILGTFDNVGWSDDHHGKSHTGSAYMTKMKDVHELVHQTHSDYVNGQHGHR